MFEIQICSITKEITMNINRKDLEDNIKRKDKNKWYFK